MSAISHNCSWNHVHALSLIGRVGISCRPETRLSTFEGGQTVLQDYRQRKVGSPDSPEGPHMTSHPKRPLHECRLERGHPKLDNAIFKTCVISFCIHLGEGF